MQEEKNKIRFTIYLDHEAILLIWCYKKNLLHTIVVI